MGFLGGGGQEAAASGRAAFQPLLRVPEALRPGLR